MAITYELIRDPLFAANTADTLKKVDDNGNISFVPICEGNGDYEEYLEWAKTNTVSPVDTSLTWDDIRLKRDEILMSTDWTMTTGATVDQAQWAAYRQNLRDLPQTYKDKTPDDVVWPTQPSTAGPNS